MADWQKSGLLTQLDTAFSRDQAEKVYVQNRILEQADRFYEWLEAGAYIYVCGDASRMAKDVDAAIHQVIEKAAGHSAEQAAAYVAELKRPSAICGINTSIDVSARRICWVVKSQDMSNFMIVRLRQNAYFCQNID